MTQQIAIICPYCVYSSCEPYFIVVYLLPERRVSAIPAKPQNVTTGADTASGRKTTHRVPLCGSPTPGPVDGLFAGRWFWTF